MPHAGHCFWKCDKTLTFAHFWRGAQSLVPATRNELWTSKSGPNLVCFVHFDFEMCFAPQRRALFRHLNFQKWSENGVLCAFWLRNVLRATTACTFWHLNFQKWSDNGVFCAFWLGNVLRATTACNFSSHLASWLRTRRFSEPTFRPSGATNHWKNTVFRNFPTFSRICIFFLLTLSLLLFSLLIFLFSLPLPCSAFHLSILSEVWLLNFLRSLIIIHHHLSPAVTSCHLSKSDMIWWFPLNLTEDPDIPVWGEKHSTLLRHWASPLTPPNT